jgi:hypothetical protein
VDLFYTTRRADLFRSAADEAACDDERPKRPSLRVRTR